MGSGGDGHGGRLGQLLEGGDGEAASAAERQRADVRVGGHERAGVHAALQEDARVAADGSDGEEDGQARPAALRHRVGDGQQPDPCIYTIQQFKRRHSSSVGIDRIASHALC